MSKHYLVKNGIIASALISLAFVGVVYLTMLLIEISSISGLARLQLIMDRRILENLEATLQIAVSLTATSLVTGLDILTKVSNKGIERERRRWLM